MLKFDIKSETESELEVKVEDKIDSVNLVNKADIHLLIFN